MAVNKSAGQISNEQVVKEQAYLLVKQGFISPVEATFYTENAKKLIPTWRQREYQNSEKLLRSYRDLKWAIADNLSSIIQEHKISCSRSALETSSVLHKNVDAILAEISDSVGLDRDISQIQSAAKSAQLSLQLLSRADEAIEHLQTYYDNGAALSNLLYQTFISSKYLATKMQSGNEGLTIYDFLQIKKSKYYTMRKKAVALFSKRLWRGLGYNLNEYVRFSIIMEQQYRANSFVDCDVND